MTCCKRPVLPSPYLVQNGKSPSIPRSFLFSSLLSSCLFGSAGSLEVLVAISSMFSGTRPNNLQKSIPKYSVCANVGMMYSRKRIVRPAKLTGASTKPVTSCPWPDAVRMLDRSVRGFKLSRVNVSAALVPKQLMEAPLSSRPINSCSCIVTVAYGLGSLA